MTGRTFANTPYDTLRVPPREDRPSRTYEVDPEAVARLAAQAEALERRVRELEAAVVLSLRVIEAWDISDTLPTPVTRIHQYLSAALGEQAAESEEQEAE